MIVSLFSLEFMSCNTGSRLIVSMTEEGAEFFRESFLPLVGFSVPKLDDVLLRSIFMSVLIAPNTFRGSLDAFKATKAIARAWKRANPTATLLEMPVADGGDLTGTILRNALGASPRFTNVLNPIGKEIEAEWGITDNKTAIIEMASASGNDLLRRD